MRIQTGDRELLEVDAYRFFGTSKRYKWFDWKSSKKEADAVVKRLRNQGHLARVVPNSKGYSVYAYAQ